MEKSTLRIITASLTSLGLLLWMTGCGQPEPQEAPAAEPSPTETSAAAAPAEPAAPTVAIPADAPVLAEVYPTLSSGILRLARLTELPEGTVLQS